MVPKGVDHCNATTKADTYAASEDKVTAISRAILSTKISKDTANGRLRARGITIAYDGDLLRMETAGNGTLLEAVDSAGVDDFGE